ncbi:hypothetical protein V8G54_017491 [Vigna mungo]|uniref:Uncharacterized protein n=1 Tax=Vigna mungo TaxID=3915 RepID=A0AAQ3S237_VIGMU
MKSYNIVIIIHYFLCNYRILRGCFLLHPLLQLHLLSLLISPSSSLTSPPPHLFLHFLLLPQLLFLLISLRVVRIVVRDFRSVFVLQAGLAFFCAYGFGVCFFSEVAWFKEEEMFWPLRGFMPQG